ncbi:hypothetical protein NA57DRAFT_60756 [Rhizodiscina lignyota]|uniref:Uncharacterized protein n=1 Tax=Rhizodiscina lignyota TaxID=1504668 RepID=A0A9P4I8R2_9PEZI|nr:hypothetical protein NA57DRAFT_60756 [Rhizodiscina lignyota]
MKLGGLYLVALWTSSAVMSLGYISICADPSNPLLRLNSFKEQKLSRNLQALSPVRNNTKSLFAGLSGFLAGALVYIGLLQTSFTKAEKAASRAVLVGLALLLCEAAWQPHAFTITERFLVLLPLCLNVAITWTVHRENASISIHSSHFSADTKTPVVR